jgi:hypothetical protein
LKLVGQKHAGFTVWSGTSCVFVQNESGQWAALRNNETGKLARMSLQGVESAQVWIDGGCKAPGLSFEWGDFNDGAQH